ncbi:hypothetical protein ACFQ2Y_22200 [Streptomyces malaysiensis subsp. malaysiensis]
MAASLAVVTVAGGVYMFGIDHDNGGGQSSPTNNPSASPAKPYTPPSGYHMVTEKKFGFSSPSPTAGPARRRTTPTATRSTAPRRSATSTPRG